MNTEHFILRRLLRHLVRVTTPIASLVPLPKSRRSALNALLTERNLLATDAVAQAMEENPGLFHHAPFEVQELRADLAAARLYLTARGFFLELAACADAGYCKSRLRAQGRALPLVHDATAQLSVTYQSAALREEAQARFDALELARRHLDLQSQQRSKGTKQALAHRKTLLEKAQAALRRQKK